MGERVHPLPPWWRWDPDDPTVYDNADDIGWVNGFKDVDVDDLFEPAIDSQWDDRDDDD